MHLQYPGYIVSYITDTKQVIFYSWHANQDGVEQAVERIKTLGHDALVIRGWRA